MYVVKTLSTEEITSVLCIYMVSCLVCVLFISFITPSTLHVNCSQCDNVIRQCGGIEKLSNFFH